LLGDTHGNDVGRSPDHGQVAAETGPKAQCPPQNIMGDGRRFQHQVYDGNHGDGKRYIIKESGDNSGYPQYGENHKVGVVPHPQEDFVSHPIDDPFMLKYTDQDEQAGKE